MRNNFFKVAFRNFWRSRGFSLINITGLAVGMAGAILILLWIQNELSFDRFHAKKDRLFEVWNRDTYDGKLQCWNSTPKILGPTLKLESPGIEQMTRINWGTNTAFLLDVGEKKLKAKGALVDPGFLTMFSFPLVEGNMRTALSGTYSVVITEELAKKLFGNEDPMNRIVRVDNKDNFSVSGVMKDLPNNTGFEFEYLLPYEYTKILDWYDEYWDNNSTTTFVELKPQISEAAVDSNIKNTTKIHTNGSDKAELFLHPLPMRHLYSRFENGKIVGGKIEVVRLFGVIAAFILLIACINFMNLSTARSEKRAKEVGIRKVVGAGRHSLILQFLGESILISAAAGILALILVQFSIPAFNLLVNKQLIIPLGQPGFWIAGIIFILLTGMLAGSYPALYLSSFKPVKILKGPSKAALSPIAPRKILVVTQFSFAIILIVSTIIIQRQIQYAEDREAGFDRDNLVFHYLTGDLLKNYDLIREELLDQGVATSICVTSTPLTRANSDTWGIDWPGKNPDAKIDFDQVACRRDFVKTLGLRLVSGRDIDIHEYTSDSAACLFNETAIGAMGLKGDPIGQTIKNEGVSYQIVGVVRDFVFRSPYQPMRPLFVKGANWDNVINFRFNHHASTSDNLFRAEKIFHKYNPAFPFEYHFADEEYANKFNTEIQTRTLAGLFGSLSILISCLGLFGLATYMAESRIKEIGIRKVLGASILGITALLSKDFIKLVLIALIMASPLAWWAMHKWLEGFDYRITIGWWVFFAAGSLSLVIALFTVSFQAIRAAMANPVRSLRAE
jgi:putative ABC transport system permease protein